MNGRDFKAWALTVPDEAQVELDLAGIAKNHGWYNYGSGSEQWVKLDEADFRAVILSPARQQRLVAQKIDEANRVEGM